MPRSSELRRLRSSFSKKNQSSDFSTGLVEGLASPAPAAYSAQSDKEDLEKTSELRSSLRTLCLEPSLFSDSDEEEDSADEVEEKGLTSPAREARFKASPVISRSSLRRFRGSRSEESDSESELSDDIGPEGLRAARRRMASVPAGRALRRSKPSPYSTAPGRAQSVPASAAPPAPPPEPAWMQFFNSSAVSAQELRLSGAMREEANDFENDGMSSRAAEAAIGEVMNWFNEPEGREAPRLMDYRTARLKLAEGRPGIGEEGILNAAKALLAGSGQGSVREFSDDSDSQEKAIRAAGTILDFSEKVAKYEQAEEINKHLPPPGPGRR